MSNNTTKFEAGQTLILDAKMRLGPGGVDGNPGMLRFHRGDGETTLDKGTPVTFVGYQKMTLGGKKKTQPVVTCEVKGKRVQVWGYRDHFHPTSAVSDPKSKLLILETKLEALQDEVERVESEIDRLRGEVEDQEVLGEEAHPEVTFEEGDELDDDTLEGGKDGDDDTDLLD